MSIKKKFFTDKTQTIVEFENIDKIYMILILLLSFQYHVQKKTNLKIQLLL